MNTKNKKDFAKLISFLKKILNQVINEIKFIILIAYNVNIFSPIVLINFICKTVNN